MRPVSRRHSRRGLVGGSAFRRTPISRSPLDKNPMPGHLSELQPVNAVNTKGQFFCASFGKNPRFQIQLDKRPLSPGTSREASGVPVAAPAINAGPDVGSMLEPHVSLALDPVHPRPRHLALLLGVIPEPHDRRFIDGSPPESPPVI